MRSSAFYPDEEYSLKLDDYQNTVQWIEKDLLHFVRTETNAPHSTKIDCFASHWLLAFAPNPVPNVSIRNGAAWEQVTNSGVIFIPPFSIVEWLIESGDQFQWEAFISTRPLPNYFPKGPIVFSDFSEKKPKNIHEIFQLIGHQMETSDYLKVEQQKEDSTLALRAKEAIDQSFNTDTKIADLTRRLNVSRMAFSSSFKKAYGLSPVAYRHRLRIFEALKLINQGESVTTSLFASGFSDHSQFVYHFKKLLVATPYQYCPRQLAAKI